MLKLSSLNYCVDFSGSWTTLYMRKCDLTIALKYTCSCCSLSHPWVSCEHWCCYCASNSLPSLAFAFTIIVQSPPHFNKLWIYLYSILVFLAFVLINLKPAASLYTSFHRKQRKKYGKGAKSMKEKHKLCKYPKQAYTFHWLGQCHMTTCKNAGACSEAASFHTPTIELSFLWKKVSMDSAWSKTIQSSFPPQKIIQPRLLYLGYRWVSNEDLDYHSAQLTV